jgi:hypothetical protein
MSNKSPGKPFYYAGGGIHFLGLKEIMDIIFFLYNLITLICFGLSRGPIRMNSTMSPFFKLV